MHVLMYTCIDVYIEYPLKQVDRMDGLRYLEEPVHTYIGRWNVRARWISEKIVWGERTVIALRGSKSHRVK